MDGQEKKDAFVQWRLLPAYLILGGVIGWIAGRYLGMTLKEQDGLGMVLFLLAWLLLCLSLAVLLQVIVHEAGHLVGGLLSGYSFTSLRIGSLLFIKKAGRIRCRKFTLPGTAGQCLMAPPDGLEDRFPTLLYNVGGCLANGLFSVAALLANMLLEEAPLLPPLLQLTAAMGLFYALLNGIPLRVGPVDNDGRNAYQLSRNEAAARSFWIQLKINSLTAQDVRLKDMPEEWFRLPQGEELENGLCASVGTFACCRAMDCLDFEEAGRIADVLLEEAPGLTGLHRQSLVMERMFCELVGENRADMIRQLDSEELWKYGGAAALNPAVHRLGYAYELLYRRDETAAAKRLESFEKAAAAYPYEAEVQGERELISCVKRAYEGQKRDFLSKATS